jgi:hypothetical protein
MHKIGAGLRRVVLVAQLACVACLCDCEFDRSPLRGLHMSTQPQREAPDAGSELVADAQTNADASALAPLDGGAGMDAALGGGPTDGGTPKPPGHPMQPDDDSDAGHEPPALRCHDVFCPVANDPVRACCTSQADVDQRSARNAARCGVALGALDAKTYGDGCWERDQLGIVDDRCPARADSNADPDADGGEPYEPGCCADDGLCGTVSADQRLGCYHARGSATTPCGSAPTTTCAPNGSYGFRFNIDAVWQGRAEGLAALTDDGRGQLQLFILLNVGDPDPATGSVAVNGRICGFTPPPFYSTTLCEAYQPIFPDRIWDARNVPTIDQDAQYECGPDGCVLSLSSYTYLLGFDMDNRDAAWPDAGSTLRCAAGSGAACFPDDDGDGLPGIQIELQTSGTAPAPSTGGCSSGGYDYRAAPLSASAAAIFNGVRRTDRQLIGTRLRVGGSVRLDNDCTTASGSALAEYANSRAVGCFVEPGSRDLLGTAAGQNERCTQAQTLFLDQSLPEYTVLSAGQRPPATTRVDRSASPGPTVSVVRFGATSMPISCDDVRNAEY